MDEQQQPRWRRAPKQVLWIVGVIVAVTAGVFVVNRFFVHRPLWDWLQLLVVPAVIAAGGLWFNAQQREREQRIASERAQDEALQAYLDGMAELITDKDQPLHSAEPSDSLSIVARARTLTVLGRLEGGRKRSVMQFLYEAGLLSKVSPFAEPDESGLYHSHYNIVSLAQADLRGAHLSGAHLGGAHLRGADLKSWFGLTGSGQVQSRGVWRGTALRGADLSEAALSGAALYEADLKGADLSKADLSEAGLGGDDLSDTKGWTEDQLLAASTLSRVTMPNGQKYEDWLRSREGDGDDHQM